MNYTVSCIIPVRNRKEMVSHAIESVLGQEMPQLEIIVVDDASSDGTPDEITRLFPWIKVIRNARCLGPGPSRNIGVEASHGRIIMFLDSDDIWYGHHCTALMNALDSGFQAAYGVTENWNLLDNSVFLIPETGPMCSDNCFHSLLTWCFMVPSSFALTRKAFMEVHGFDSFTPGEDWLFFLKLARKFRFAAVTETITLRRLHKDSLSCAAFDSSAATDMLSRVRDMAENAGCGPEEISRIDSILNFTERHYGKWKNVQDWYMSLKRHGLI